MIRAGRRRHRITFQAVTETKNALHEPVKTWADITNTPNVYANVQSLGGSESAEHQTVTAEESIKITLHPREDITTKMRVVYRGRYYQIKSISPYDPQRSMVIRAHETA